MKWFVRALIALILIFGGANSASAFSYDLGEVDSVGTLRFQVFCLNAAGIDTTGDSCSYYITKYTDGDSLRCVASANMSPSWITTEARTGSGMAPRYIFKLPVHSAMFFHTSIASDTMWTGQYTGVVTIYKGTNAHTATTFTFRPINRSTGRGMQGVIVTYWNPATDHTPTAVVEGAIPAAVAGASGGILIGGTNSGTITFNGAQPMATYTQPTGFLAATFPTTVASTTNITAGTLTTVTNLTNAPTNGDLTATMKTSVQIAAAAAITADGEIDQIKNDVDGLNGSAMLAATSIVSGGAITTSGGAVSVVTDVTNSLGTELVASEVNDDVSTEFYNKFIFGSNEDQFKADVSGLSTFDPSTTPVEILASGGSAGKNAEELVDDIWDEDSTGHYTSPNMAFAASQTGAGTSNISQINGNATAAANLALLLGGTRDTSVEISAKRIYLASPSNGAAIEAPALTIHQHDASSDAVRLRASATNSGGLDIKTSGDGGGEANAAISLAANGGNGDVIYCDNTHNGVGIAISKKIMEWNCYPSSPAWTMSGTNTLFDSQEDCALMDVELLCGFSTGAGTIPCTTLVLDQLGNPVQYARVFVYNSDTSSLLYANTTRGTGSNGQAIFFLDPLTTYRVMYQAFAHTPDSSYVTIYTAALAGLKDTLPMNDIPIPAPASVDQCTIYGYVKTLSNDPVPKALVTISPVQGALGSTVGGIVVPRAKNATTDANGMYSMSLTRSSELVINTGTGRDTTFTYKIEVQYPSLGTGYDVVKGARYFTIPDSTSHWLDPILIRR